MFTGVSDTTYEDYYPLSEGWRESLLWKKLITTFRVQKGTRLVYRYRDFEGG